MGRRLRRNVIGKFSIPLALKWRGRLATLVIAAAAIIMVATWAR